MSSISDFAAMRDAMDRSAQESDDALVRSFSRFDYFRQRQSAQRFEKFLDKTQVIVVRMREETPRSEPLTMLLEAMERASGELDSEDQ